MTDQLTVTPDRLENVTLMLGALGSDARARLMAAVEAQALIFESVVKEQKLSGQVLNTRSVTLRNSIHTTIQDDASGIRAVVGTDVVYAAIHEYGGVIKHPGGTAYLAQAGGLAVFISNSSELAATLPRTKPHDITMPERSYLRSTLSERQDEIRQALAAAVAGAA